MHRFLLPLVVLLALIAGGVWVGSSAYDRPGPLATPRDVLVPHGGPDVVAATLLDQGVIDNPTLFRAAVLVTHFSGPLHAAELAFPPAASLREVLRVLRLGRPVQHHLTIPEGLTAAQIAELIGKADALNGDMPAVMEGNLLPETYAYERGTSRTAIFDRASAAMEKALTEAWGTRSPGLPLTSAREALILASIVERETAKPEERPRIAAVFLNRLRQGMKLQSDPTVIYGVSNGLGELDHKLTRADLDHDSPYNTYRIPGLPPGPIDSPGIAALRAVTQPAATGDLYFVADGTGGHAFSETLEGHNRNVARYRALQAGTDPAATDPLPTVIRPTVRRAR